MEAVCNVVLFIKPALNLYVRASLPKGILRDVLWMCRVSTGNVFVTQLRLDYHRVRPLLLVLHGGIG